MSKYKILAKKTARMGVVSLMLIVGAAAIYIGASMFSDSVAQRKQEAESKLSADKSLLGNLQDQLSKSGEAGKRYIEIDSARGNSDYTPTYETLSKWFLDAKTKYRFAQMNMNRVNEQATDKPELTSLSNYSITVRPRVKLDMQAVSDTHVFSFIDDMLRSAPGLVRVESLKINRKNDADMTDSIFNQLRSGVTPLIVEARIEFTLISVAPKESKDPAKPAIPGAPAP